MGRIVTIDLETTINGKVPGKESHAADPANRVVAIGMLFDHHRLHTAHAGLPGWGDTHVEGPLSKYELTLQRDDLAVGCNIKFDMLHLLKRGLRGVSAENMPDIWDIQLAEYLLSGQTMLYPSLEGLADKYGIPFKKDVVISNAFASGIGADKIDPGRLLTYLESDVLTTDLIFKKQLALANSLNMLPLITSQMNALRMTIIMEYYGMLLHGAELFKRRGDLAFKINNTLDVMDLLTTKIITGKEARSGSDCYRLPGYEGSPAENVFNSPKYLQTLFWGGELKVKATEPDGFYKNGKPKTKSVLKNAMFSGIAPGVLPPGSSVDEAALNRVIADSTSSESTTPAEAGVLASLILSYREVNKELSTYVDSLIEKNISGRIHANLSHVSTATGRLASNGPNMQNNSPDVRKLFVPHPGYKYVEIDFNQLEIVALAWVSGDKQLREDIISGTDIHTALYLDMYGVKPTAAERKAFKPLTFGLVYGSGANGLSQSSGKDVSTCKQFIKTFYTRYPGVKKWHDALAKQAKEERVSTAEHTEKGLPRGKFTLVAPTGRRLVFKEYDNSWGPSGTSFSPTQLKNYPIQSLATGDIVPHVLGEILDYIEKWNLFDKIRPVMTVHDSVLFEVIESEAINWAHELKMVMSDAVSSFSKHFGVDFDLPLRCSASIGDNWGDMKEI